MMKSWKTVQIEIQPTYGMEHNRNISTPLKGHTVLNKPSYESIMKNNNQTYNYEKPKPPRKGSMRKDMERYKEDL